MKARTVVAGVAVLGIALTACGEPKEVTGLRDDVKMTKAVKAVAAQTHVVKGTKQEKYCTSTKKGVCKSYGYRTVPDNKVVTDKPGTPGTPAKYCVELDHVKDGDSYRDDVWFNVNSSAYYSASGKNEGEKISKMQYNHEGC